MLNFVWIKSPHNYYFPYLIYFSGITHFKILIYYFCITSPFTFPQTHLFLFGILYANEAHVVQSVSWDQEQPIGWLILDPTVWQSPHLHKEADVHEAKQTNRNVWGFK